MKNTITRYFKEGIYTEEQVKIFVKANWITEEEYLEITGIKYVV